MSKLMCGMCKHVIESKYRHDMQWCDCHSTTIDGGNDYKKVSFKEGTSFLFIDDKVFSVDSISDDITFGRYEGDNIILTSKLEFPVTDELYSTCLFTFKRLISSGYVYEFVDEL